MTIFDFIDKHPVFVFMFIMMVLMWSLELVGAIRGVPGECPDDDPFVSKD